MKWFRFYSDVLDDPKVQRLPAELFKAWVNILCLANQGPERGVLPSLADIAFRLRVTDEEAGKLVSALVERELLDEVDGDLVPHNWDGRQPKSDHVTSRVQRHRAKRNTEPDEPVTGNVSGNVTRTTQNATRKRSRNAPDKNRRDTDTETEETREIAGDTPAETPAVLVDAYCQVRGQPFPEDAGPFINIGKSLIKRGYTSADVERCARFMLTDPYWQSERMTFKALASQLPEWVQNGRPERAPGGRDSPTAVALRALDSFQPDEDLEHAT